MRVAAYALMLACAVESGMVWSAQKAGTVTELEGEVLVLDSQGTGRGLKPGAVVNVGDTVQTGKTGQVHLRMQDDAYLAIRSNTRLTIQLYKAANREDDGSVIQLLKGSFRAVTGWIGQIHPANYKVLTPTASIGIRGTDHEPVFVPEEEATEDSPAGTYDQVHDGGTVLESEGSTVDVQPGKAGFAPLRQAPRLLAAIPAFLRNRPLLDARLEAIKPELRARVQEKLERMRSLRQELDERRQRRLRDLQPNIPHLPNLDRLHR